MSIATPESTASPTVRSAREFRVDSLAVGMIVMLALTVIGRGIGFVRSMAFCRLMDDTDVGRWSMAFGFISLITPVMLLGIPGVLPKFSEHFRVRGQLSCFIRRIAIGTTACTIVFVTAMVIAPSWFGYAIFLQPESAELVYAVAGSVAGIIAYNFVSDLNASLRQIRVVSLMQFIHGVGFTGLSIGWLSAGGGFTGVIWMFAFASLFASLPGIGSLVKNWESATSNPGDWDPIEHESDTDQTRSADSSATRTSSLGVMIRRLAPYAFALWMANLIGNCFELSDRYMILHFMPVPDSATIGLTSAAIETLRETIGQAAVGQYHSGRIVPMMLLSVGLMVAGVLVPYLSTDWEEKRFAAVRDRVSDMLLALSLLFTLGSALSILAGPFLFDTMLQGRYVDGMRLMPMALCFSIWSALVSIGQCYLLTAERGRSIAIAMSAGFVTNLILNAVLLPRFGLTGAVIATLLAHAVVMLGHWIAMSRYGYDADGRLVVVSLLPVSLLISPWAAIVITGAITYCVWTDPATRDRIIENLPERLRNALPL